MKVRAILSALILPVLVGPLLGVPQAYALGSSQNPQSGAVGFEATVPGNPPSKAASIGIPSDGQTFTSSPITISGLCTTGLLVKLFSNNVFIGSAVCTSGSYSLQADLFSGRNDLVARVFDALDQQGPDSNTVTVTYNDAQFAQFGTHVMLTSTYARRGADPNTPLNWPIVLSGGVGPYAISTDWGDGSGAQPQSAAFPGVVNISHTYAQAGVYQVIIKVSDHNGTDAYLQVVGVADGKVTGALASSSSNVITNTVVVWQPMLIALPLLLIAFWLGRRHELYTIRKSIEESRKQV